MTPLSTSPHPYRLLIFWVGIIATVAYRAIIIINKYDQTWGDIVWYIGTIGFVWYFVHRFNVEEKRDRIIKERSLVDKIHACHDLKEDDREAIAFILKSQASSLSRWNYIVIFIASALALGYDVLLRLWWR